MGTTRVQEAHRLARQVLAEGTYSMPVDVERVARDWGIDIRYQALEDTVSGMLVIRDGRAVIGVNERHHPNRQRFTVAHELGHYLLHEKQSHVFIDAVYFRDEESAAGSIQQETEANAFAAELLMPEAAVKELVGAQLGHQPIADADDALIRRIAARFGVSAQALTIRLTTLGLIQSELQQWLQ